MPVLIAPRALQGLGGGGLIALAQTIVGDIVPPRERGRYQVYIGALSVAWIAGPVLGGVFAEHLHWSLIFWINLPLGLLAFLMTSRALKTLPRHERPHELDVLGAALMMRTVSLLLALNWAARAMPGARQQIVVLLAGSAGCCAVRLAPHAAPSR